MNSRLFYGRIYYTSSSQYNLSQSLRIYFIKYLIASPFSQSHTSLQNTSAITKNVDLNLRFRRMKRGLSQEDLAELSGVSQATIGSVERGEKSQSVQTLAKVANALNIDLYKLFIFDED